MRPGPEREGADAGPLPAGRFSVWLGDMEHGLNSDDGVDVPCGSCNACCRSAQFIPIAPDETEVLERIPPQVLLSVPGMPAGHVVLGYDEHGRCAMLVDGQCSIYEHRPRTCRTYDCRVFAAAGIDVDDPEKASIAQRARRWRFEFPTARDRVEHDAVRSAARFLDSQQDVLPDSPAAVDPTQRAVVAIRAHGAFRSRDAATGAGSDRDEVHVVAASPKPRPPVVVTGFGPQHLPLGDGSVDAHGHARRW